MWMWPRSDLHSWVKVLNRFDDILKAYIDEYELDKLQINPFTQLVKATITEILKFSTLLLDNYHSDLSIGRRTPKRLMHGHY